MKELYSFDEKRPVAGLRWFRTNASYDLLSPGSYENEIAWPVNQAMVAKCMKTDNPCNKCPSPDCACGLGGRLTRQKLFLEIANENQFLAVVIGWGRVTLSDDTWAAQYAQPVTLIEHMPQLRMATTRIADKYVLPVELLNDVEDFISLFESSLEDVIAYAQ